MCFDILHEAANKGELILIDGGLCRYHLRRDGQLTIHDLISQRPGAGRAMLALLKQRGRSAGATSILARCPVGLAANGWYAAQGFSLEATETAEGKCGVKVWRLSL